MNESELKSLWNADAEAPRIDFSELRRLMKKSHDKLRKRARIDAWSQGLVAATCVVPVFIYPKLIFAAIVAVALGIWYIRELQQLYIDGPSDHADSTVREALIAKRDHLQAYFWRTRIAVLVSLPMVFLAACYGIGAIEIPWNSFRDVEWLVKLIVIAEIAVLAMTEIYFLLLYKPALKEVNTILDDLKAHS